jgi:hypothetical protein
LLLLLTIERKKKQ